MSTQQYKLKVDFEGNIEEVISKCREVVDAIKEMQNNPSRWVSVHDAQLEPI